MAINEFQKPWRRKITQREWDRIWSEKGETAKKQDEYLPSASASTISGNLPKDLWPGPSAFPTGEAMSESDLECINRSFTIRLAQ